ncbi:MAG: hypothetical protein JW945_06290 [Methanomicrobia archaeon]|nr:hypothetical protein [Methanomicrobia archaeon]
MVKCELCGTETEDPLMLYGREVCRECFEYYKAIQGRGCGCCSCGYTK